MTQFLKSISVLSEKFPETDQYPFCLQGLKQVNSLEFNSPITLFAGDNGTGKSTLLEGIARACGIHIWNAPEGTRYKANPYEKKLCRCIKVNWDKAVNGAFFGSDIFKDFRNILDEWAASDPGQLEYFGGKSLVTQSHGQSIMSYFRTRYKIEGVYFLDEPETALSPKSQLELMEIIQDNAKKGHAQFFIASHSPILLALENANIYNFDKFPLHTIAYEKTEHYKVYRQFLINRDLKVHSTIQARKS